MVLASAEGTNCTQACTMTDATKPHTKNEKQTVYCIALANLNNIKLFIEGGVQTVVRLTQNLHTCKETLTL